MTDSGLPLAVERFIAQWIDSVALLETLLLVRAAPERRWTPGDVGRAQVTRADHAMTMLGRLVDAGVVVVEGEAFRYAPGTRDADVDALAEAYATRRPTVIGLVFAPRDTEAEALADAFRFRRRP